MGDCLYVNYALNRLRLSEYEILKLNGYAKISVKQPAEDILHKGKK